MRRVGQFRQLLANVAAHRHLDVVDHLGQDIVRQGPFPIVQRPGVAEKRSEIVSATPDARPSTCRGQAATDNPCLRIPCLIHLESHRCFYYRHSAYHIHLDSTIQMGARPARRHPFSSADGDAKVPLHRCGLPGRRRAHGGDAVGVPVEDQVSGRQGDQSGSALRLGPAAVTDQAEGRPEDGMGVREHRLACLRVGVAGADDQDNIDWRSAAARLRLSFAAWRLNRSVVRAFAEVVSTGNC